MVNLTSSHQFPNISLIALLLGWQSAQLRSGISRYNVEAVDHTSHISSNTLHNLIYDRTTLNLITHELVQEGKPVHIQDYLNKAIRHGVYINYYKQTTKVRNIEKRKLGQLLGIILNYKLFK